MYIREKKPAELLDLALPYLMAAGLIVERVENHDGQKTSKLYAPQGDSAIKEELDRAWLMRVVDLERERLKRLDEVAHGVEYFFKAMDFPTEMLSWKDMTNTQVAERLQFLVQLLQGVPDEHWKSTELEMIIKEAVTKEGLRTGECLWPMRVALSGRQASPPPFDIASILGKKETLHRLTHAITRLSKSH
jgi:glutamyl/glutaminyl-tRNA synthetase